jgi:hypothetical protein
MYIINDQQMDFILNDIRRRGIKLESLQQNLLDHVCILIEHNLEEDGDFEHFYSSVIKDFYKHELREIEEEALFLLTLINNHPMKKAMIISGTFSIAAFAGGSFCKIMESHLTDFLLFLAFTSFVFLFIPLIVIVKIKEKIASRDRLILVSGVIAGLLYFFCMLLKCPGLPNFLGPRWPHMDIIWLGLWLTGLAIALFIFIPAYFFSGIRKPETKTNTIVISIFLVAFIGIQFTLTSLKPLRSEKHPVAHEGRLLPEAGALPVSTRHTVSDTSSYVSGNSNNKFPAKRIN